MGQGCRSQWRQELPGSRKEQVQGCLEVGAHRQVPSGIGGSSVTAPRRRRQAKRRVLPACVRLQEQPTRRHQHPQHTAEGFQSALDPPEVNTEGTPASEGASPPRLQREALAPEELENPEVGGRGGVGEGRSFFLITPGRPLPPPPSFLQLLTPTRMTWTALPRGPASVTLSSSSLMLTAALWGAQGSLSPLYLQMTAPPPRPRQPVLCSLRPPLRSVFPGGPGSGSRQIPLPKAASVLGARSPRGPWLQPPLFPTASDPGRGGLQRWEEFGSWGPGLQEECSLGLPHPRAAQVAPTARPPPHGMACTHHAVTNGHSANVGVPESPAPHTQTSV